LAIRLYITRDSVAASDDIDAPHLRTGQLANGSDIGQLVATCLNASPLPNISGGQATWCLSSLVPLAVIAQQWTQGRLLSFIEPPIESLDLRDNVLRLHFSYFDQLDPDDVFFVLQRLRLKAIG